MSKRKQEKREHAFVESSESTSKYPNDNSAQNEDSSKQINDKEIKTHRPRGRPRKTQKSNTTLPDNKNKTDMKSAQSSPLSPMISNEKKKADSNLTIQPNNRKSISQQTNINKNHNKDKDQKKHHAKNGNIVYKNIHNNTNTDKDAPSSNLDESSPSKSNSGFNYIVTHSRLETIETRINDNQITEMIHPAQCIVYDRLHQEPLFLNQKESEKRKNYRIIHTLKRIPSCWEPMPWDKEEEKMTKFENIQFSEMIEKYEPSNPEGEVKEWYISNNERSGSKQRKKRPYIPFIGSLNDFSTDTFDDQTDFDFYE